MQARLRPAAGYGYGAAEREVTVSVAVRRATPLSGRIPKKGAQAFETGILRQAGSL